MADLVLRVVDRGDVADATGHPLRDLVLCVREGPARAGVLSRLCVPLATADRLAGLLAPVAEVVRESSVPPADEPPGFFCPGCAEPAARCVCGGGS